MAIRDLVTRGYGPGAAAGLVTRGYAVTATPEPSPPATAVDSVDLIESEVAGTYGWESQYGAAAVTLAVGQPRSVSSPARQYLPVTSDATQAALLGRIIDWRSSEDSVFALEVVVPDTDLAEGDTPTLIPPQLAKYIRYYVLSRAFGRPGEGRQPILADFYGRRFQRGVALFRAMGDVSRIDRVFQRQEVTPERQRPRYVRLPSTYPSVW